MADAPLLASFVPEHGFGPSTIGVFLTATESPWLVEAREERTGRAIRWRVPVTRKIRRALRSVERAIASGD